MGENLNDPDLDSKLDDERFEDRIKEDSDFVGGGLVNDYYNICYINSALQVLFCTVPLIRKLKDVTCQKHISGDDSDFCCLKALTKLFKLCMRSHSAVLPEEFLRNLNRISSHFQLGSHEDSHEFLLNLLEHIKRNCNDGENTIEEVFGIRSIVMVLCGCCPRLLATEEPMFFLSLPISDALTNSLNSYIKVERRGVKCDRCNTSFKIAQSMIRHAPKAISFQFNRYNNSMEKDHTAMEYPLELNLRPYIYKAKCDEQTEYVLYAVIEHVGLNTDVGHYVCYVRSSATTWHLKNDEIVCKVSENEVLNKVPYMLFYVKKGTPWFSSLDLSELFSSPTPVLSLGRSSMAEETPEKEIGLHVTKKLKSGGHWIDTQHVYEDGNLGKVLPSKSW